MTFLARFLAHLKTGAVAMMIVWLSVMAMREFGESGELTIELPFATSYARALEYLVFAGEGRDVLVRGISCRRVAG